MTARTLTEYLSDATTTLPAPMDLDGVVEAIVSLHQRNGGATFSLYFGELSGQELYAVSVYPERSALEPGKTIDLTILRRFISDVGLLLHDPRNSIGTWYDADNDETYLDVSTILPDQETAVTLGIRYNQIAVYDLANGAEIPTGGTGEGLAALPPEERRLPDLVRARKESSNG